MNELLVMRHAKSDWRIGASDFDRPLNPRGERAAQIMAGWILDEDLVPDRILASPANRARTTAAVVASACDLAADDVELDRDLYLTDAFTWLQKLMGRNEARLLVCGHNPGLDDLVDHLCGGTAELTESGKLMTTAAVAHFRLPEGWASIARPTAELLRLVRPTDLA